MWRSCAKNGWISVYGGGHPIRSRSARARTFGGQNLATSVLAPKSSRQSSPRHVLHKPNQFWSFFISNSERFDNTLIKFELLGRIEWKKSKLQISNAKPKLNANQEWYTHFAEVPGLSARLTVALATVSVYYHGQPIRFPHVFLFQPHTLKFSILEYT